MSAAGGLLLAGLLLLALVLLGRVIEGLPLSSAMVYLGVGLLLGPAGFGLLQLELPAQLLLLERLAEAALLISLFAVGLQLGVPLRSRRWWLPLRLAFLSMALMVGLITAVGVLLLGLPLGGAVLLGALLAPTDPVLAGAVPAEPGQRPDRLGFSLAAEGGLNDGSALPFVLLGLGLLGHHDLGPGASRWLLLDLLWAPAAGLLLGGLLGWGVGRLVVYLRARHQQAVGLDVFLGLGLIALSYGLAQLLLASGFLAVFAAGLALQRVGEHSAVRSRPLPQSPAASGHDYETLAVHPQHASATMRDAVQLFNGQLEKLAELALVLLVGVLLGIAVLPPALLWFVPLLLLVLRPLATLPLLGGQGLSRGQAGLLAWFGIRGIGSLYYLLFALRSGVDGELGRTLTGLTLGSIAASIVLHGLSAQPLMRRYLPPDP